MEQRIRVLRALHELKVSLQFESFEKLGLDTRAGVSLLEVLAELNMISEKLVEWFLGRPDLVTEGVWPMQHVLCICKAIDAPLNLSVRLTQLAENVLLRLHSTSFLDFERAETIKVLARLQELKVALPLQCLELGDFEQRMRVLQVATKMKVAFGRQ